MTEPIKGLDQPAQGSGMVPLGPQGMVIAIQYFHGDEQRCMRLARLLAAIEPKRRDDVTLAFCRRFDTPMTPLAWETFLYCGRKFGVCQIQSERRGVGHPCGANELWAGTMEKFAEGWPAGIPRRSAVFLIEHDGCPLRADWISMLLAEHARSVAAGYSITGPYMGFLPHINGTLIMQVPWWIDHPSVHQTPPEEGWDIYHRETILADAYRTKLILNLHGSRKWKRDQLVPIAGEYAWMTSAKDDSVITWAEKSLVAKRGKRAVWKPLPRLDVTAT